MRGKPIDDGRRANEPVHFAATMDSLPDEWDSLLYSRKIPQPAASGYRPERPNLLGRAARIAHRSMDCPVAC
jgi:hypothetical protein